ncbi:unnamed protein product [Adineta steineri]|uniref:Uncharacterized protein n=2 Tax=Adineta steineri TaxID=433720 RepID=A0A813PUW3_9BILA|nr:unnamed protein product [Adineta steineri]
MKKKLKRIQIIHRTKDGKCNKFWQNIDFNRMITLKHIWIDVNQQSILSSDDNQKFYCYKTKKLLPEWYHIDLLNDNDQILIDEFNENVLSNKPTVSSIPIQTECLKNIPIVSALPTEFECFKNIPKKKQLNAFVTNRSFVITNKYSIPNDFYQQWEEGKMHKNTNNYRMIF